MKKLFLNTDIESILLRNSEFFDDLDNEQFLILGASGFIGSWVTEVLLQANIKLGKKLGDHKIWLITGKHYPEDPFFVYLGFKSEAILSDLYFHMDFIIYTKKIE